MGIWNSMQLTLSQHRPIKNSVIRIELSPSPEHTQFYDIEDWQNLWQDFAEEFDKQVITGKDGKGRSCPTNLANSKYSVWLHTESKGEVPHLHAAVCRLDEYGNIKQRPQHSSSCATCCRASGKETRLDNCGANPKSQHSTSEPGLYGGVESNAIVVMG